MYEVSGAQPFHIDCSVESDGTGISISEGVFISLSVANGLDRSTQ